MSQRSVGGPAAELSDEELVRWCQRALPGDPRPFELLVARYQRVIFGLAYRLSGDPAEADDLAQEAFVRIYRGVGKIEAPAALRSWIYQITTNVCLDALERRRRAGTVPLSTVAEPRSARAWIGTAPQEPDEQAIDAELRHCLEETLRQMPPAERAAVVLRDVEGRAYQEIADALRLGLSAVKMRIHRARLAFQERLRQVCPDAWRGSGG